MILFLSDSVTHKQLTLDCNISRDRNLDYTPNESKNIV